jgi:hypothetical protein
MTTKMQFTHFVEWRDDDGQASLMLQSSSSSVRRDHKQTGVGVGRERAIANPQTNEKQFPYRVREMNERSLISGTLYAVAEGVPRPGAADGFLYSFAIRKRSKLTRAKKE